MERREISIRGIVQGVGFRPFVHRLASRLGLHGFVRNQSGDVLIEVEGEESSIDRFLAELTARPPPLSRIDDIRSLPRLARGDPHFRIEPSTTDTTSLVFHAADIATCEECLAELFDPGDRRYRYPFLNCTNCGPRFTIIRGAPYDKTQPTDDSTPSRPPAPRAVLG
jgi:hydrogenase maturation protein HypF